MSQIDTGINRNLLATGGIARGGQQAGAATTSRFASYLGLALAALVGGGALFSFMLFLYRGPSNALPLNLGPARSLLLDAFLSLLFFIQHSVMARWSFKQWLARILPKKYFGSFYAVASGVALLPLLLLWQESGYQLLEAQGLPRYALRAAFFLAIANVLWVLNVGLLPLFSLQTVVDELRQAKRQPASVLDKGPFRRTRHPLYFSSLVLLWSNPDLTLDRLLLNVLFTVWVVLGTLLEERDLAARFGDAYREYRGKVPMLIPRLKGIRSQRDREHGRAKGESSDA